MIFTNISEDRTVKLTDAKDLEAVIRIFNELREKASWFVNEKEGNTNRPIWHSRADAEEISFTEKEVVWTYEENTACNCHPEYEKREKKFSLVEFHAWLTVREDEFYIGEPATTEPSNA